MAWTGLTLTVDGRNVLNEAQVSGKMNIISIVVGDGAAPANFSTRKELVHRLYEITDLKVDLGDGECTVTADIPQVNYDYYFREIGVVVATDRGNVLYVYDNCGDSAQYIVSTTGVESTRKRIRLLLRISDVAEITVSNPSILYVGYVDYEQTVGRLEDAVDAAKEEAAGALEAHAKDADNPHKVSRKQLNVDRIDNTADMDKPVSKAQSAAIDAVKRLLSDSIKNHVEDTDNPHKLTKAQVGLDKVNNTSDTDKPVSAAQQAALEALYEQMASYTRQKIADLINGAPSNLDTLKEVSDAIAAHKNIMDALNEAIGKKANAAEFDSHTKDTTKHITAAERTKWNGAAEHISDTVKHITAAERTKWNAKMETTGDSANNTAAFTSGDAASPTGWADIGVVASGEKHSSLFRKMSLAVKNLRYLYKVIGTTNISAIGGGTLTGAINALNTGLEKKHIPVTVIKEGVIESGPSRITISGNIVTLNLNLWKESGWGIEPKDEVTAKIPKEYAPEAEIVDICILGKSSYEVNGIGYFYINNEGNMHISNKLNLSSVRMARVNLSYEI